MANGEYILTSATIAMFLEGGRHVAHMLPTGAIITVKPGTEFNGNKLVEVQWDGNTVMMFAQDLRERSKPSNS